MRASSNPPAASTSDAAPPPRRANHLLWFGPLMSIVGVLSYYLIFSQFPATRDVPWVNLPLVIGGAMLSFLALWRARRQPERYRGRWVGGVSVILSSFLLVTFVQANFVGAAQLPAPPAWQDAAAPTFALPAHTGETLALEALRGEIVLLVFYRGAWCPFCISELSGLQKQIDEFRDLNVVILAISSDPLENSVKLADSLGLPADVDAPLRLLADPDLAVIDAFQLRHEARGMDRPITRPALLLLDREGVVRWEYYAANYRVRARPSTILAEARALR
ncbi:MAG: peroxiredoxin family protein [Acidobacteriota bacterium]